MNVRKPAVAGQFYSGKEDALRKSIEQMLCKAESKIKATGIVSPHAGFMYSGPVAGHVYSNIEIPGTVVILGPNHTGIGEPYAIMTEGKWLMPFGEVEIESSLAKDILNSSQLIKEDLNAHKLEHSLEVQVPFLQYFRPDIKIVPIVIGGGAFLEIGEAIAKGLKKHKKDFLIVASSDMTHYESHESAKKKDKLAIDAMLKLDEKEMLNKIRKHKISMCGYGPASIMLIASKILGAKNAKLVRYMTSGDTSGDYSAVVGYAGIAVY
jgi:AmmeMemoRadiSam system protein B